MTARWHWWGGHEVSLWDFRRRRCEAPLCRLRGPVVFRFTNGKQEAWLCWRHRHLALTDGQRQLSKLGDITGLTEARAAIARLETQAAELQARYDELLSATRQVDDMRMTEIAALNSRWRGLGRFLRSSIAECQPYRDSPAMDGRVHAYEATQARMAQLEQGQ